MMFFFNLLVSFLVFFSNYLYKRILNPISIFSIIWFICINLHQSGLIYYNPLTNKTWIVIIFMLIVYSSGNLIGRELGLLSDKNLQKESTHVMKLEEKRTEKYLKRYILFFSLLSSTSIIPSLVNVINIYGLNIFLNLSSIYHESITSPVEQSPSIGFDGLIFIAVSLSGIYLSRFKFNKLILVPLFLLVLTQLTNGSRGSLATGSLLFLAPFISNKKKIKIDPKQKKYIHLIIILLLGVFIGITFSRKIGDTQLPYASDFLKRISSYNKTPYSIVTYLTIPIAVLNEYLKEPTHYIFGASTFRVFYMVFNRIGLIEFDVNFTRDFLYYTPQLSNVMTFIGELIYDFKFLGAYLVVFILSVGFGFSYYKTKHSNSIFWQLIFSVCFSLIALSFFAWYLRLSIFWYVLLFGGILGIGIDIKNKTRIKY